MRHAIFASPQVAGVGLTESEAKAQGIDYAVASYDYYNTAYGSFSEDRNGFVKVLAERGSGEILGAHIIGTDASMLIQEVVNAMREGITVPGSPSRSTCIQRCPRWSSGPSASLIGDGEGICPRPLYGGEFERGLLVSTFLTGTAW